MARIVPKLVGSFVKYFVPCLGLVSYGILSCFIMDTELLPNTISKEQWATILLAGSITCIASYLYRRKYMQNMKRTIRLLCSLLLGSLFGMGSVLLWLLVRVGLRNNNNSISIIFGLLSAAVIAKIGRDYVRNCDKLCEQS